MLPSARTVDEPLSGLSIIPELSGMFGFRPSCDVPTFVQVSMNHSPQTGHSTSVGHQRFRRPKSEATVGVFAMIGTNR